MLLHVEPVSPLCYVMIIKMFIDTSSYTTGLKRYFFKGIILNRTNNARTTESEYEEPPNNSKWS